jgi:hypothetical protein
MVRDEPRLSADQAPRGCSQIVEHYSAAHRATRNASGLHLTVGQCCFSAALQPAILREMVTFE